MAGRNGRPGDDDDDARSRGPGPGAYDVRAVAAVGSASAGAPAYTIGERVKTRAPAADVPGPGHYGAAPGLPSDAIDGGFSSFVDGGGGGGGGVAEEPAWEERRCDACERTLRGDAEWRAHVSGRRHRKRVASLRKKREGKHGVPPGEKGCSDAG